MNHIPTLSAEREREAHDLLHAVNYLVKQANRRGFHLAAHFLAVAGEALREHGADQRPQGKTK